MSPKQVSLLQIHSAVLLFALSGLFGKWLAVSALVIVFSRAAIASLSISALFKLKRKPIALASKHEHWQMLLTGTVLAVHWLTFFAAIQVSSVTIGLLTFASFPVFVALMEPIWFREPFHFSSTIQALLTLLGIYLVVPIGQVENSDLFGALLGIASAFSFAVLALLNRQYASKHGGQKIALWQNAYAALSLLPFILLWPPNLNAKELAILVLLGVVFTALAHSLFISALKYIKAQTASIIVTLEPIYGVIAASILLDEQLTTSIALGAGLIIGVNLWAMTQAKSTIDEHT